jgi:6-phosphogluconolactonase (cycloisomerase 2 family)
MGVALSPVGAFAYASSGRFRADNAIGVYKLDDNGELNVVQEFMNNEDELRNFRGGNEIALSPDGLNVYAVARVFIAHLFRPGPAVVFARGSLNVDRRRLLSLGERRR